MLTACCVDRPAQTLSDITSEPGYAGSVSELIQSVAAAADEADAVTLLSKATRYMGAESSAFVSFVRDD
jgi:predicted transcriptional regulator of viral defense system